jgi:putative membrane protein
VIGPDLGLLVAAASVYRVVPIAFNALAWERLIPAAGRPPFRVLLVLRWIGEAVNSLIPWGQAGGDLVRARLLSRRGVPSSHSAAVMVADLALGLLTQIVYASLGLAAGAVRGTLASRRQILALVAIVAAVLVLAAGPWLVRALVSGRGARRWPKLARRLEAFHAAFRTLAVDHRNLIACAAWHLVAWLSQVGETWLVLGACGAPVTGMGALWVESLAAAGRSLAFFVPAGLGAQEVALLGAGRSLGLDASALVTLALVKRLRELVTGGLGLGAWVLVRRGRTGERAP